VITRRYFIDALVVSALTIVLLYLADFKVPYHWDSPPPLRGNAMAFGMPASLLAQALIHLVWDWILWIPWPFMEYGPIFIMSVLQWLWVRRWWDHVRSRAHLPIAAIAISMIAATLLGAWIGGYFYRHLGAIIGGWAFYYRWPGAIPFILVWLPQVVGLIGKFGWSVFLLGSAIVEIARTALDSWASAVRLWRMIAISLLATAILGWRVDLTKPMLVTLLIWLVIGGILFVFRKRSNPTPA
jgi:uncharacterized membrane protein